MSELAPSREDTLSLGECDLHLTERACEFRAGVRLHPERDLTRTTADVVRTYRSMCAALYGIDVDVPEWYREV